LFIFLKTKQIKKNKSLNKSEKTTNKQKQQQNKQTKTTTKETNKKNPSTFDVYKTNRNENCHSKGV
jgi:hypothetical protein